MDGATTSINTMPIMLSTRTNAVADVLFDEPMRSHVKRTLLDSVSENIPFCDDETPEGMDRIRFSIMKLTDENSDNFAMAVELAQTDWRDLFMAAGFGHDANEHNNWFAGIVPPSDSRGD